MVKRRLSLSIFPGLLFSPRLLNKMKQGQTKQSKQGKKKKTTNPTREKSKRNGSCGNRCCCASTGPGGGRVKASKGPRDGGSAGPRCRLCLPSVLRPLVSCELSHNLMKCLGPRGDGDRSDPHPLGSALSLLLVPCESGGGEPRRPHPRMFPTAATALLRSPPPQPLSLFLTPLYLPTPPPPPGNES